MFDSALVIGETQSWTDSYTSLAVSAATVAAPETVAAVAAAASLAMSVSVGSCVELWVCTFNAFSNVPANLTENQQPRLARNFVRNSLLSSVPPD